MAGEQAFAAPSARIPADPSGTALAGLLDVLDRADGGPVRQRPRAGRSAAHRPAAYHLAGAGRATRALPPARPVPTLRRPTPTPAAPAPRASVTTPVAAPPASPATGRLRALVGRLVERASLWGAGPGGAHRSWGPGPVHPPRVPAAVRTDGPVVLRELPSTPTTGAPRRRTVAPAGWSPAASTPWTPGTVPALRRSLVPSGGKGRTTPTVEACSPPAPSSPAPSAWSPPPTGSRPPQAWRSSRPAATRSTPPSPPVRPPGRRAAPQRSWWRGPRPLCPRGGPDAGRPVVLSGQGVAPAGATIEAYGQLGLELVPGTGLLAATVPGAIGAWLTLLRDHGTLPLDAVLRYAIEYAETGHPVHPRVVATVASVSEHFRTHWPTSASTWLSSDGAPPAAGSLLRNPVLASTYRRLLDAARGPSREAQIDAALTAWYSGFVAEAIDRFCRYPVMDDSGRPHPGFLTGARPGQLDARRTSRRSPSTGAGGRSRRPGRGPRDRRCSRRWRCWTGSCRRSRRSVRLRCRQR